MHWVISEPVGEDGSDDSAPGNISNFPLSEQSSLSCLAYNKRGYIEPQGKEALEGWYFQQNSVFFFPSQRGLESFTHSSCVQLCLLALRDKMTLLLTQEEVSAPAERTASFLHWPMLVLGSVKGIYQAKSPTTPFFPWSVPLTPHLQCTVGTSQ